MSANSRDVSCPLGFQQNAQHTRYAQAQASCSLATILLVEQDQIGFQFGRQGDGLCFAPIQVTPQRRNELLVLHVMPLYPGGRRNVFAAGPGLTECVEFVPDAVGNVKKVVELMEQLEAPYSG